MAGAHSSALGWAQQCQGLCWSGGAFGHQARVLPSEVNGLGSLIPPELLIKGLLSATAPGKLH